MRKLSLFLGVAVAAVVFAACGGGGGGGTHIPPGEGGDPVFPTQNVLYLDSDNGPVSGVPYVCDFTPGKTDADGGFVFTKFDTCTFNLTGFLGTIHNREPLYIIHTEGNGVVGIPFECRSGTNGWTGDDGSFDYDVNDSCSFNF